MNHSFTWRKQRLQERIPEERIVVRVDSLVGMVESVRNSMGVGVLLCLLADDAGFGILKKRQLTAPPATADGKQDELTWRC